MTELSYPIELQQSDILALLPHRGDIQFVHSVRILAHNHYIGRVRWRSDLALLQGHGAKGTAQAQGHFFVQGAGDDAPDVVGLEDGCGNLHGGPSFDV